MKIAILSRKRNIYSTQRLKEACLKRGHQVRVWDPLNFSILLEKDSPQLHYLNKPLPKFNAVIPRIGVSITFFGTAVLRQLEGTGVYCLNSSLGISHARDKLKSIQILSRHHIDIPPSVFIGYGSPVVPAIAAVGGGPLIIKLLEGSQGVGVILAETNKVAETVIQTLHSLRQDILIQKFIKESRGKDIRAFVVGQRVVAAMRRLAVGDEFRTNVHQGGKAEPLTLDPAYERIAIQAARVIGLNVAGVDILESDLGPKVMEVNASPGLEAIEQTTGVDVAEKIIEFLEKQVFSMNFGAKSENRKSPHKSHR